MSVTSNPPSASPATMSQACAREIMGENFSEPTATSHRFGLAPSAAQLASLEEVPYSEEVLKFARRTHVLVPVFPLSIIEMRERVTGGEKEFFYFNENWYLEEDFARDRGETKWHLVRKTPVPDSESKTWEEQRRLLTVAEETPSARVMAYTMICHYWTSGEHLFKNVWVRTSDLASDRDRVNIGCFGLYGFYMHKYWEGFRDAVGIASARKS